MSRPRPAKTLIEMAIVVAITSVALMLSATTLVALFGVERQTRGAAAHQVALARLSSRWRADVHASVTADFGAAATLSLPDGSTIHYATATPSVTREVRRAGQVIHRDAFILAAGSQIAFLPANEPSAPLLRLAITPSEGPRRRHQIIVRPTTIAAALNLHRAELPAGGSP